MRSQTGFDGFYAVMIVVPRDILDRRENLEWHHPSTTFYDGKVWSGTVGKAEGASASRSTKVGPFDVSACGALETVCVTDAASRWNRESVLLARGEAWPSLSSG